MNTLFDFETPTATPVADGASIPPTRIKPAILAEHPEIPPEYRKLFDEYVQKVRNNKINTMMWILLDYGHRVQMLEKEMHILVTQVLLESRDETDVKMAVEAMSRTLGIWSVK